MFGSGPVCAPASPLGWGLLTLQADLSFLNRFWREEFGRGSREGNQTFGVKLFKFQPVGAPNIFQFRNLAVDPHESILSVPASRGTLHFEYNPP